jgi:hypothetical protein
MWRLFRSWIQVRASDRRNRGGPGVERRIASPDRFSFSKEVRESERLTNLMTHMVEQTQRVRGASPAQIGSVRRRILTITLLVSLLAPLTSARAGSVGDFFKALGNSIAHPGDHRKPKPQPATTKRPKAKGDQPSADYPPSPTATPTLTPILTPTPTATLSQPPIRPASAPPQNRNSKRDMPYGIPVPNKPGFVTSPFSPKSGYVDVRGFPSGTEVKDPYSGKTFLTP